MQTPPLLPSLNAPATAVAPPARAQDVASGDQQFTKMLSRQMAERDAAKTAARAAEGPKPVARRADSGQKPNSAASSANTEGAAVSAAGNPTQDAGSAQTSGTSPNPDGKVDAESTAKASTKSGAKESTSGDASITGKTADATLDASAAIMALVANAATAANATTATKPDADTSSAAASATDLSRLLTADRRAEKIDVTVSGASAPSDTVVSELAAKGAAAFSAALQGASEAKTAKIAGAAEEVMLSSATLAPVLGETAGNRDAGATLLPLQPVALSQLTPPGLHPGDVLAPRISSPNWDQSLGQRMVWMVAGAEQSASLTLNPPDLGPMQVVLHVSNGQADASFYSAQPEVRQALEAALPKLREMLSEAGVTLGQTNVSAGNPHSQKDFAQSAGGGARRNDSGASTSTVAVQGGARKLGGNGLVDTFA